MPDNTSEFFTDKTKQKWLGLVPRECSLGFTVVHVSGY